MIKMSHSHNIELVNFEKNNKNRIHRKFQKLCLSLSTEKLSFVSLDEEIKFLNQLYFLHQKINDLCECLDETKNIIYEVKNEKKISKSFTEEVRQDNIKQHVIKNLATLVFLSSDIPVNN